MNIVSWYVVAACAYVCAAESWRWPDSMGAESVRIDSKLHFIDTEPDSRHRDKSVRSSNNNFADEPQFEEPTNTEGFYNLPPGVGRYPVRVETHRAPYRVDPHSIYNMRKSPLNFNSDGTLDSFRFCKCVSTPDCNPSFDSTKACGVGKFLCCYKRPNKHPIHNSEFFNEVEDERPMLLPGQPGHSGPFPPPPDTAVSPYRPGHPLDTALISAAKPVLVGPNGPTGIIGPPDHTRDDASSGYITGTTGPANPHRGVLVGPGGPTGAIGPSNKPRDVLVGPGGPTGVIGPGNQNRRIPDRTNPTGTILPDIQNHGVLVGPGGPTGIIGPTSAIKHATDLIDHDEYQQDIRANESAQRGILVGPGGPTGIIGPAGYGRRPVLVGPGGPTGIIGPYGGRGGGPPVLVGPGGPTGIIGPARRPFYGCTRQLRDENKNTTTVNAKPCKKKKPVNINL